VKRDEIEGVEKGYIKRSRPGWYSRDACSIAVSVTHFIEGLGCGESSRGPKKPITAGGGRWSGKKAWVLLNYVPALYMGNGGAVARAWV